MDMTVDSSTLSNEKVLFLLNKDTGMAPYSHEFIMGDIDTQVLSGFVSAMLSFMGEVTGDECSRWKTHYGSDNVFIVEGGKWVVGVLAVSRETTEVRSKLRRVVKEFEEEFQFLQRAEGIDGRIFDEFDHYVRRVFLGDRLSERSILLKRSDAKVDSEMYRLPSIAFKVANMLQHIGEGTTLGEVAALMDIDIHTAKDLASRALWRHSIYILYVPSNDDILVLSERSSSELLHKENPFGISQRTIQVVASLDGRTPLRSHLSDMAPEDIEQALVELADFINKGYIQRISLERKLVLIEECVLNKLVETCADIIGRESTLAYLENGQDQGVEIHPWIARIKISSGLKIECWLDITMTPADFDEMYEALRFLIKNLLEQIASLIETEQAEAMLTFARKQCRQKWKGYVQDVTI